MHTSTGSNVYLVLALIASACLVPMRQAFSLSYPSQAAKDQSLAAINAQIRSYSESTTFGKDYKQEQALNEMKAAREKIKDAKIDPSGSGSGGSVGGNSSAGNAAAILQANQAWEQRRQTLTAEMQRRLEEIENKAREQIAKDAAYYKQREAAGVASLNRKGQDALDGLDALERSERSEDAGARRNAPPNLDDVIRNSREYRARMEQLLEQLRTEGLSAEEAEGFVQTRFGNSHEDAMKNPDNFDPDESESCCCHDDSIQVTVNASGNATVNVTINKGQAKTSKAKESAKPVNLDKALATWFYEEDGTSMNYNWKGQLYDPKPVPGDPNTPFQLKFKYENTNRTGGLAVTHYNDQGQQLIQYRNEKGKLVWKPIAP